MVGDENGEIVVDQDPNSPNYGKPYQDPAFLAVNSALQEYNNAMSNLASNPTDPNAIAQMDQLIAASKKLLDEKGVPLQDALKKSEAELESFPNIEVPANPAATVAQPLPTGPTSSTTTSINVPRPASPVDDVNYWKQKYNF